ncbi:hypothetical protein DL96DRAFT_1616102 [Flagelloscypha sp. PMI_526]|nr:hypothetical protein DL96DRAFT_1616102 [Flagelloscypha sp. PMI_526]
MRTTRSSAKAAAISTGTPPPPALPHGSSDHVAEDEVPLPAKFISRAPLVVPPPCTDVAENEAEPALSTHGNMRNDDQLPSLEVTTPHRQPLQLVLNQTIDLSSPSTPRGRHSFLSSPSAYSGSPLYFPSLSPRKTKRKSTQKKRKRANSLSDAASSSELEVTPAPALKKLRGGRPKRASIQQVPLYIIVRQPPKQVPGGRGGRTVKVVATAPLSVGPTSLLLNGSFEDLVGMIAIQLKTKPECLNIASFTWTFATPANVSKNLNGTPLTNEAGYIVLVSQIRNHSRPDNLLIAVHLDQPAASLSQTFPWEAGPVAAVAAEDAMVPFYFGTSSARDTSVDETLQPYLDQIEKIHNHVGRCPQHPNVACVQFNAHYAGIWHFDLNGKPGRKKAWALNMSCSKADIKQPPGGIALWKHEDTIDYVSPKSRSSVTPAGSSAPSFLPFTSSFNPYAPPNGYSGLYPHFSAHPGYPMPPPPLPYPQQSQGQVYPPPQQISSQQGGAASADPALSRFFETHQLSDSLLGTLSRLGFCMKDRITFLDFDKDLEPRGVTLMDWKRFECAYTSHLTFEDTV